MAVTGHVLIWGDLSAIAARPSSNRCSNAAGETAEVSSGRSSVEGRIAIDVKDQRSRTGQRLVVLVYPHRLRPREGMNGA